MFLQSLGRKIEVSVRPSVGLRPSPPSLTMRPSASSAWRWLWIAWRVTSKWIGRDGRDVGRVTVDVVQNKRPDLVCPAENVVLCHVSIVKATIHIVKSSWLYCQVSVVL